MMKPLVKCITLLDTAGNGTAEAELAKTLTPLIEDGWRLVSVYKTDGQLYAWLTVKLEPVRIKLAPVIPMIKASLDNAERQKLVDALKVAGGSRRAAARALQWSPGKVARAILKHKITKADCPLVY
jgi:transcriptional regulator with GAF, ATPase, and Fis domain